MMKAPPYTYAVNRKLAAGETKTYWRFRHPKTGDVSLPEHPGAEKFIWRYKQLLAKAGVARRVSMNKVRKLAQDGAASAFFEVYFIGIEPDGPIKIGFSADVPRRLSALQGAHPYPLRLLARLPGGARAERALHRALSEDRLNGEWFRRSPGLMSLIRDINDGAFSL